MYIYQEEIRIFLNFQHFSNLKVHREETEGSKNFQFLHYFGVIQQSASSALLVQEEPHSTLKLAEVAQSV